MNVLRALKVDSKCWRLCFWSYSRASWSPLKDAKTGLGTGSRTMQLKKVEKVRQPQQYSWNKKFWNDNWRTLGLWTLWVVGGDGLIIGSLSKIFLGVIIILIIDTDIQQAASVDSILVLYFPPAVLILGCLVSKFGTFEHLWSVQLAKLCWFLDCTLHSWAGTKLAQLQWPVQLSSDMLPQLC